MFEGRSLSRNPCFTTTCRSQMTSNDMSEAGMFRNESCTAMCTRSDDVLRDRFCEFMSRSFRRAISFLLDLENNENLDSSLREEFLRTEQDSLFSIELDSIRTLNCTNESSFASLGACSSHDQPWSFE